MSANDGKSPPPVPKTITITMQDAQGTRQVEIPNPALAPKERYQLDVATCGDWSLLVAVMRDDILNVAARLRDALFDDVWRMTDAYGGFVPEEYDWSGIRDASAETKAAMAAMVRAELTGRGIVTLECERTVM